jgi:hypothetical protein
MDLRTGIKKAEHSIFYRWLLNRILWRAIPFNSPHSFLIVKIAEGFVGLKLPFIRKNKNHINGVHACALATASEYATGLCLMSLLSEKEYRIILKSIHMDYHFQGKTDITFDFKLDNSFISQNICAPLQTQEAVFIKLIIEGYDTQQKHISTGTIEWQVKRWDNVKTKI